MKVALPGAAVLLSPIYDLWQASLIETEKILKLSNM
jgi:hypothetical protein